MRPNPQLIQCAASETRLTVTIAAPGDFTVPAIAMSARLTGGVLASMKPVTSTSSICIENASRPQNPSPHIPMTASGPWPSIAMAATIAISDRSRTKTYGSGR